ncbi:hypothetical protein NGA84_11980 [Lactococcus formosensis]|uniref:Uncharacterized protein n=1 Tax=Lactococcus formosensis TaxID=1281486 RepID=A0A9X4PB85_9LACT|nr:hypothetical protein [Lactococcus formosensis]MDG6144026.1 hypothetical protein [Lactococcus formosensis]MDG6161087.1 hypothetical protein [Lactococcus formosensis]MDG6194575.1 hypothetical protein [Lactococcus formosensis]
MSKLRNYNFIASLRSEHKEVMTKITDNKYDLATQNLDEEERKILEKLVQYQEWTADKILELAAYNAKKNRKEENIEL